MALSVLVALMMLAVPLASSSNLFVDGGQTNSNGDAPVLGASTGYTVTFQLNADDGNGISLDEVDDLDGVVAGLNSTAKHSDKVSWYVNENSDLCALVLYDKESNATGNVTIQQLINDLYDANNSFSSIIKKEVKTTGDPAGVYAYTLEYWNDVSGSSYEYKDLAGVNDTSSTIKSDMTFTAQWIFNEERFVKTSINVVIDGETTKYFKAYELKGANNNQIIVDPSELRTALTNAGINTKGLIISNELNIAYDSVYDDGVVTYGDGIEISSKETISSKSTITITYTFNDRLYSPLTVSSEAFRDENGDKKDVTLYISKSIISKVSYDLIYKALLYDEDDVVPAIVKTGDVGYDVLTENGYLLTGWDNGAESTVMSKNLIPSGTTKVTLDAELNGYYVVFMSKGQFEYVYVPFGELSADLVKTLDLEGVNHWAWINYTSYHDGEFKTNQSSATDNTINTFTSFTENVVKTIDGLGQSTLSSTNVDVNKPVVVIVACFDLSSKTAYAVFDANSYAYNNEENKLIVSTNGNFGNKYVDKIIVPGTTSGSNASLIPTPAVSPVYEEGNVFINYRTYTPKESSEGTWADYVASGDKASTYSKDKDGVSIYSAKVIGYKHTVTFYNGSEVNGVFYYTGDPILKEDITSNLVAFSYNGVVYDKNELSLNDSSKDETKAFNNILFPAKDGYTPAQWKDVDGKVMIDKLKKTTENDLTTVSYELKFDKIKSDLNLYISFEAKDYKIEYKGNTAIQTNTMEQFVDVDETVNLFGESTFSNDGYKLKEWNTRPDGNGTSYALNSSFTLNGEQFKDLKDGKVTLYAIWEKVGGSGSESGDNTDGDNGSNTDTYLLAGILIVIIILIIVVAVILRKK